MNQEKIILQIEAEVAGLKDFVRKLKPEEKIHKLDIDLLKQKILSIYDAVYMLEPYEETVPKATISDIKKPVANNSEDEYDDSFQKEKHWNETKNDVLKAEDLVTKSEYYNESNDTEKEDIIKNSEPKKKETAVETQPEEKPGEQIKHPENEAKPVDRKEEIKKEDTGPQPDLFSSAPETLADKLSSDNKPTLAEKLSQNVLKSLKQYIGINEKFLFINELFKGEMSKYNKAVEELDSMPTFEGANTYLFELKIQNQWDDDSEAFKKFKELIEKKFQN